MTEWLHTTPGLFSVAYTGLFFYVTLSLANPADESLNSFADVFVHRGKTLLAAALSVPILVLMAQYYNELNVVSAFGIGYANTSLIRKASEGYMAKTKLGS